MFVNNNHKSVIKLCHVIFQFSYIFNGISVLTPWICTISCPLQAGIDHPHDLFTCVICGEKFWVHNPTALQSSCRKIFFFQDGYSCGVKLCWLTPGVNQAWCWRGKELKRLQEELGILKPSYKKEFVSLTYILSRLLHVSWCCVTGSYIVACGCVK